MKIFQLSRFLFSATRYIRWSLIIASIVMMALMLATDITTMTNKYDIDSFSKEKLDHEQTSADRYKYILVGALLIAFIASLLLVFHNKRVSRLQSLHNDQLEASVATSNQTAQEVIERQKQLDAAYKGLEIRYKEIENENLKLIARANEQLDKVEHQAKRVETLEQDSSTRHIPPGKEQWLREKLSVIKGKSITVTAMASDNESIEFANELMKYFLSAGWFTTGLDQLVYPGKPVGLQWRVKETPNALAEYLVLNFKTIGFDSSILLVPELSTGDIELNVLYKP